MNFDRLIAYAAFLLVAAAVPIVFALLQRRLSLPLHSSATGTRSRLLSPLFACAVLSFLVAAAGMAAYRIGSDIISRSVDRRLQAVATLKATLVSAFIDDVREGIKLSIESPAFFRALDDWRQAGAHDKPGAQQRLAEYLTRLSKTEHYIEIGLHDPTDGALLLSTTSDEDAPEVRHLAVAAATAASPTVEEFRGGSKHVMPGTFYLSCFGAVSPPGGGARVVVHVGVDPRRELFPLIEQWPGPPQTSEVLLLRREGDAMVVLNDTPERHRGQALRRVPTADPRDVATALVRNGGGALRGYDDTGQPVFAHAVPVAGTSWFVMAQTDEARAFAELNLMALLAAAFVGALWLLAAWWWVERQRQLVVDQRHMLERAEQARRLAELSRRVVSAQEDERRRWSSELHDRTGANLAAIKLNLKAIARLIPSPIAEDAELLEETSGLLADTVASIRDFCSVLRPALLDYAGLVPALETAFGQFERRTGVLVRFEHEGFEGRCNGEVESTLFRITQEALLNCAKHAQPTQVAVTLSGRPDRWCLTIADDGVGFDPSGLGQRAGVVGHGLLNMSERASVIGARFAVDSQPGAGTRLTIERGEPRDA